MVILQLGMGGWVLKEMKHEGKGRRRREVEGGWKNMNLMRSGGFIYLRLMRS